MYVCFLSRGLRSAGRSARWSTASTTSNLVRFSSTLRGRCLRRCLLSSRFILDRHRYSEARISTRPVTAWHSIIALYRTMSAFDDIVEDDMRGPSVTASFAQEAASASKQIHDNRNKCEELLRLAHEIPLDVQPAPYFVALLEEIWAEAQSRDQVLSWGRAAAERVMDVAQRVRARAGRADTC
jgi:hypothetical protein